MRVDFFLNRSTFFTIICSRPLFWQPKPDTINSVNSAANLSVLFRFGIHFKIMCLIIIFVLLFAGFLQAAGWSVRPFEKATGYGTNGKSCEGSTGLREVGCPCDGVGYNCKDPLSRCLGSNGLQGNSAKMKVNQQGVCVCAPLAAFYNTTTGDCQTASEGTSNSCRGFSLQKIVRYAARKIPDLLVL